jgi:hypothetical protein
LKIGTRFKKGDKKMSEKEEKGWKYYFFKKQYSMWIYAVIMFICAIVIYFWIQHLAGL